MVGIDSTNFSASKNVNQMASETAATMTITPQPYDSFETSKPKKGKRQKSTLEKILHAAGIIFTITLAGVLIKNHLDITKNMKNLSQKLQSPTKQELEKILQNYNPKNKILLTNDLIKNNNLDNIKSDEIYKVIKKIAEDKKIDARTNQGILYDILDTAGSILMFV